MALMLDWPEYIGGIFLAVGFFFAIFSKNIFIIYAVCFLMGLLFGRAWFKFHTTMLVPLTITILAFLLGFMLGSIYANLKAITLIILAGTIIGYQLHEKKIIRSI